MKFENKDQVKAWLRTLPDAQKEMKLKIDFYNILINDLARIDKADEKLLRLRPEADTYKTSISNIEYYRNQITECRQKYECMLDDLNRLSKLLTADENAIITAKYLKGATWDAMEFMVFFSRRQCFRILDRALEKLIGQSVNG